MSLWCQLALVTTFQSIKKSNRITPMPMEGATLTLSRNSFLGFGEASTRNLRSYGAHSFFGGVSSQGFGWGFSAIGRCGDGDHHPGGSRVDGDSAVPRCHADGVALHPRQATATQCGFAHSSRRWQRRSGQILHRQFLGWREGCGC